MSPTAVIVPLEVSLRDRGIYRATMSRHEEASAQSFGASHRPGSELRRYLVILGRYVWAERRLLMWSTALGICGLCLPFVFPRIIGVLLDRVVLGHGVGALELTRAQRLAELRELTGNAVLAAVGFSVVGYGKGHITLKLGNHIITRLRRDVFQHLQRLSLQFFTHQRTGTLAWRLLHEVNGVANLVYAGALMLMFDLVQLAIAVACLFHLSPKLAAAVLGLLPLYVAIFVLFNPRVRAASERVNTGFANLSGSLQEQLSAISLVKAFGSEHHEIKRFMTHNRRLLGEVLDQSRLGHLMGAASEGVVHLGTAIIVGYGGWLAFNDSHLTVGRLTEFIGYVGIMYGPVRRCADLNLVYQNSLVSVRHVLGIFDIAPQVVDRPCAQNKAPRDGEVVYSNVSFGYANDVSIGASTSANVLHHIHLRIGAGERVAIVGPSGAGKTSIALLLARLYDVGDGRITIDGVDVRDYTLAALRAGIGIVQQDATLFSGSVYDNIAYDTVGANKEAIVAASKAANAHQFIMALPAAYDTELGERGVNLSGGQRQRLSIARTLLRNPRILILDEATSALDGESEGVVQEALDRLMHGRTSLIIAHRLSTIQHADRIFTLHDGRIVESGTHAELLAARGWYARLVGRDRIPSSIQ